MRIEAGHAYQLTALGKPLELRELGALEPAAHEVIVQVAGCGICHTDVGFAFDGVPTRKPLPIVLGHEISGRVVAAGDQANDWIGRLVIVPAVIPCGTCAACQAGRPTICRKQFMPGNDGDGGFATHVRVPARGLCPVPEPLPPGILPEFLSVIADAVTTPWEAIRRAAVGPEDVAVFVGVGGVGGFGVQVAAALGAAVVAVDINDERLRLASEHGASLVLNSATCPQKELKVAIRSYAEQSGRRGIGLKIFETSGTIAGQQTAFALIDFGAYLAVVGYTAKKAEFRLSNLMAFDATARGNWGCPPEQYPVALDLVLKGNVAIAPYIEAHSLEEVPQLLEAVAHHAVPRRVILKPAHNGTGAKE